MPFPKKAKPIVRQQESTTVSKPKASDSRFASLSSDPRYRLPSKKNTHTKLDKRFDRILKDDEFSKKASVDRYGRKLQRDAGRKELERLYQLEDEDEGSADEEVDVRRELRRMDRKYDPARDGGFSESSSDEEGSSDADSEDEGSEVEEAELYATEEQVASIPTGEVSKRIAVVNMDWDNVRAEDIMAVALSFLPAEGRIESVSVYPSEFGRERMDREEIEGPPKELFANSNGKLIRPDSEAEEDVSERDEDEDDSDVEEERIKKKLLKEDTGEEYNSTALRKYQLDRLRYYYAVISCSSKSAAQSIYGSMDGREYLSSANFFDLRFVTDDVSFDDKPRDSCTTIPRDYKPNEFVTDALRHSKVKLTWDAEDKHRKEVQKRAFSRKEIDDNDLQAYIGSASSEDESEDEDEEIPEGVDIDTMSVTSKSTVNRQAKRDALRAALGLTLEPEQERRKGKKARDGPVGNMEVSFVPGLSATSDGPTSVFENDPRDIEESTKDRYIRKERERKARRKERMKAKREGRDPDESDSDVGGENGITEATEANEDLGFDDPFFHDPDHAEKERKKAKKLAKEKRRKDEAKEAAASASQRAELELLMADTEDQRMRHFDMREIRKAEKAAKLKGKKKKGKKGGNEQGAEGTTDSFKMDTADPRFARMFENHEFAIDPTNPRFKKSEGMKQLMEEGRKKREKGGGKSEKAPAPSEPGKEKKRARSEGNNELSDLVQKMKKRAKQA